MSGLRRLLLAPVIVALSALAFVRQAAVEPRYKDCAGWLAPQMDEHWARLANWRAEGDFDHVAKNVLAEWCRLDPQRAGKVFSFLLVVCALLNAVLILTWSL